MVGVQGARGSSDGGVEGRKARIRGDGTWHIDAYVHVYCILIIICIPSLHGLLPRPLSGEGQKRGLARSDQFI